MGRAGHVAEPVVGMQTERERCIQRMGEAIRPSPRGTIGATGLSCIAASEPCRACEGCACACACACE